MELRKYCRGRRRRTGGTRRLLQENTVWKQLRLNWLRLMGESQGSGSLQGSDLGPLYIYYGWVAWCSCRNLISGRRNCPTCGPFFYGRVALFSLDVLVCVWFYCSLLCCACLISLGGLLFSERRQKQRRVGSGGEEKEGKSVGRGGRGNCGQDERRIKTLKKR